MSDLNIDKMIKKILDERILNDGLTAKGWKKYNDGITKAVQVVKEHLANEQPKQPQPQALPLNKVISFLYSHLEQNADKLAMPVIMQNKQIKDDEKCMKAFVMLAYLEEIKDYLNSL